MNARFALALLATAAVAATAGWWFGARPHSGGAPGVASAESAERKIKFYQSPMHPWITSDKPGKCTICGMDLVPVYEGESGIATDGDVVTLSAASASVIGVATTPVRQVDATRSLGVTGTLEDNETRHQLITAWTDLRIDRIFVNQVGQTVAAGDPLAEIYSRELHIARQEFNALARRPGASSTLLAASRAKLRELGLLDQQIEELTTATEVPTGTRLLAPIGGVVVARGPQAYAGSNVSTGTLLFELADLSELWAILEVPEADLGALQVGQTVTLAPPSLGGETINAPITFIDPTLDMRTRTAKVRVPVANTDDRLRHRESFTAQLKLPLGEQLVVPRGAVLFTRAEPIVFLDRTGGAYAARPVTLGPATDQGYVVRDGLNESDRVVTTAALLLEGQAQLSFSPPPAASPAPAAHTADISALEPLILASADAAAALAADDLAGYQNHFPTIQSAWRAYLAQTPDAAEGPLATRTAALVEGPDLDAARRAFEPFSTTVADLAHAAGLGSRGTVHIFQCPMTPVLGTGRWVQRNDSLRNPFFGSAMLECGEEVR